MKGKLIGKKTMSTLSMNRPRLYDMRVSCFRRRRRRDERLKEL